MSKSQSKTVAFCKACKDAGKPASVFESHSARNARGKVCCPTIMNNRCSKCDNLGHFPKYCTVKIKSFEEMNFFKKKPDAVSEPKKEQKPTKSANAFEALASDSDEEEGPAPANVTIRKKAALDDWSILSDDEDEF